MQDILNMLFIYKIWILDIQLFPFHFISETYVYY